MCLASGLLMRRICQIAKVFLAAFLGAMPAFATHVAVLETIAASDVKERVSLSDRQYLTNILREQAVMELPVEQNYTIMTRENINAMLPPPAAAGGGASRGREARHSAPDGNASATTAPNARTASVSIRSAWKRRRGMRLRLVRDALNCEC